MGPCPECGTELDHEELLVQDEYVSGFCCVCSKYRRKRLPTLAARLLEDWS